MFHLCWQPAHFSIGIHGGQVGSIIVVPWLAPLMALAFRFEGLVSRGEVRDYAELARLGHVSRARITQLMNLGLLCPRIQEEILFLPPTKRGRDPLRLELLQPIALEPD